METIDRGLDCHEQYSRRNCLLIHGVKENKKEHTDEIVIEFFKKKMEEKLSANDTDRFHRLERKQSGSRPWPIIIIIKFNRYNVRKAVSITLNLAKKRITQMKVARETYGFENLWPQNEKALYTDANDRNTIKVFYD